MLLFGMKAFRYMLSVIATDVFISVKLYVLDTSGNESKIYHSKNRFPWLNYLNTSNFYRL